MKITETLKRKKTTPRKLERKPSNRDTKKLKVFLKSASYFILFDLI